MTAMFGGSMLSLFWLRALCQTLRSLGFVLSSTQDLGRRQRLLISEVPTSSLLKALLSAAASPKPAQIKDSYTLSCKSLMFIRLYSSWFVRGADLIMT